MRCPKNDKVTLHFSTCPRVSFHLREGAAGRESAIAFVEGAITNALAGMLFVETESIDSAKSVADFGVDSLIAVQLQRWSLEALGTNISLSDVFDPSESIRNT